MKTILILLLLVATTLITPLTFIQKTFAQTAIDGFSPDRIAAERRWEEQFRAVPDPKSAREHLRRLTIEPHIAGTKEDYDTAVYVRDQLRSYGLSAELREYEVWLNYPKSPTTLELITTRRQPLSTREAVVPGDPTSSNPKITPLFNGYSASGDVTAPVVYANYGLPGDYEELKKAGVDVKGKIVIVRYGNSFRGVKAKVAEDNGAVGCIIYSDPEDDGYMQGDVYPKGPWRPVASGQRGSVQYLFDYPGDPLTPGKQRRAGFYQQTLERLAALPGVTAVGGVNGLPMVGGGNDGQFLIDNNPTLKGYGEFRVASPGYFNAMGMRLVRGRLFDKTDGPGTPQVALISESLARQYWPNEDPLGKGIQYGNMDGDMHLLRVVGVVSDVREFGLEAKTQPTVYVHYLQRPLQARGFAIVARTPGDVKMLIPAMRNAVQSLNRDVPTNFRTLDQVFSSSLDKRRFSLVIFGSFAAAALLLAALGIYGVTSYAVTQRTQEVGIRIALGARVADVLRLVIGQGMKSVLFGIAIGLCGAFALTRLLAHLLFNVSATDPLTFMVVTALLTLVGLLACYVPARRATRVDPMIALRYE